MIADGEAVVVTGVLGSFMVAEFKRDYDLGWALKVQEQLKISQCLRMHSSPKR